MFKTRVAIGGNEAESCAPLRRNLEMIGFLADAVHLDHGNEKAAISCIDNGFSSVMIDASICGLGQAAPNPIRCIAKYFPQEVA